MVGCAMVSKGFSVIRIEALAVNFLKYFIYLSFSSGKNCVID